MACVLAKLTFQCSQYPVRLHTSHPMRKQTRCSSSTPRFTPSFPSWWKIKMASACYLLFKIYVSNRNECHHSNHKTTTTQHLNYFAIMSLKHVLQRTNQKYNCWSSLFTFVTMVTNCHKQCSFHISHNVQLLE